MDYYIGQDGYYFGQPWNNIYMLANDFTGYQHYASSCQPAYPQRLVMQPALAMTDPCTPNYDPPAPEQHQRSEFTHCTKLRREVDVATSSSIKPPCILPASLKPYCVRQPPLIDTGEEMSKMCLRILKRKFGLCSNSKKETLRAALFETLAREEAIWTLGIISIHPHKALGTVLAIRAYVGIVQFCQQGGQITFKLTDECIKKILQYHRLACSGSEHVNTLERQVNSYTHSSILENALQNLDRFTGSGRLPLMQGKKVEAAAQIWLEPCKTNAV